jgi:hypothetical protein
MIIDYSQILTKKYPNQEWTMDGDDYSGLTWLSDSSKPTQRTLDALWETVKAERIADIETRAAAKNELLDRLGITADEVALLLG